MVIHRIRRTSGRKGGQHHYYHADVICRDEAAALRAAKQGRVSNWRWIDTFDVSTHDYCEYEPLGAVSSRLSRNPQRPLPLRIHRVAVRIRGLPDVHFCWVSADHSTMHIGLTHDRRAVRAAVEEASGYRFVLRFHRPKRVRQPVAA